MNKHTNKCFLNIGMPTNKRRGNNRIRKKKHFVTTMATIVSGKNHQWMLKLVGENLMGDKIFT